MTLQPFYFSLLQVFGALLMGFGLWMLFDNQSFIAVLRKSCNFTNTLSCKIHVSSAVRKEKEMGKCSGILCTIPVECIPLGLVAPGNQSPLRRESAQQNVTDKLLVHSTKAKSWWRQLWRACLFKELRSWQTVNQIIVFSCFTICWKTATFQSLGRTDSLPLSQMLSQSYFKHYVTKTRLQKALGATMVISLVSQSPWRQNIVKIHFQPCWKEQRTMMETSCHKYFCEGSVYVSQMELCWAQQWSFLLTLANSSYLLFGNLT